MFWLREFTRRGLFSTLAYAVELTVQRLVCEDRRGEVLCNKSRRNKDSCEEDKDSYDEGLCSKHLRN